jgi:CRISPR-associated protein Cmr2
MEKAYQINPELIRGAYLCDVCGKRVILGATKDDFKSSITKEDKDSEKNKKDRLCAFCYAKRYYHGEHKKSVVDVALEKYLTEHKSRIQEIFKNHGKADLFEKDKQNIYIEVLENNKEDQALIKSLKELYRKIGYPPVYYAIVVMDGDSMGEKISKAFEENKIKIITEKLSEFSKEVKRIVEKYSGMSVYSGGDDVLALFPLETALEGYKEIVEKFKEYMKDTGYNFTASAGLVISHYKIPLSYVLQEARSAESKAKKVDKEKKEKDAVCIKYIKHSFSSAEALIKNDHLQLFKKLISFLSDEDFPFGFIYQLQELLLPYLPKTEDEDPVEKLTKYLIEKKPYKRKKEFAEFMLNTKELFNFREPEKIINTLKVAKFMASGV